MGRIRTSGPLFAAFLTAAGVIVSACGATCNVPSGPGPYVDLDVTAWAAVHPTAQATACLATHCVAVPPGEKQAVVLRPASSSPNPGRPFTLRMTATENGHPLLDTTTTVVPKKVTTPGPCAFTEWTRNVTLTEQGKLSIT